MRKSTRLAQHHNLPTELRSAQVMIRVCLRLLVIVAFASFGGIGFARSLAALSWMSAILSAVAGILKRERPFGVVLNHWDETLVYAALFCLTHDLDRAVPT
ncbi:MAG: hypothetical protein KGK01_02965 [Bradyrhizobium sp.]|uniref:hypothetical protein n=1 Tax=Bradyrhizobium sp. TaxID=376 RepID=UPI001C290228|nr:hypothetical protein [Bradyrhizobium sp.]MBU6461667.1 hypothetical protein [Pseudomonadota bacterium]MDE2067573.1 hypothetical protein [Bradyrhizobium sp.]MDE2241422.1 hypothetical protein [Bradyrhizobium sp.]MDE2470824.1 hypothetical protein [Bradyrhizobium sp.]